MLEFKKKNSWLTLQVYRNYLSSAYTPLKSHISGINILCFLRFAKNCTRKNKDTTFDHKIAKFDTRKNFCLYGIKENGESTNGYSIWKVE